MTSARADVHLSIISCRFGFGFEAYCTPRVEHDGLEEEKPGYSCVCDSSGWLSLAELLLIGRRVPASDDRQLISGETKNLSLCWLFSVDFEKQLTLWDTNCNLQSA